MHPSARDCVCCQVGVQCQIASLLCRLKQMVLKWLPVSSNAAIDGEKPAAGPSPIKSVLRSKGFMWMSHTHGTAFFWSHAGQHFEIRDEGDW